MGAYFLCVEVQTLGKKVPWEKFGTEEHGWARERCRLFVWKCLQENKEQEIIALNLQKKKQISEFLHVTNSILRLL